MAKMPHIICFDAVSTVVLIVLMRWRVAIAVVDGGLIDVW